MNVKPLFDRVIAKEVDAEKTTKTGIFLPSSSSELPIRAKIIAVPEEKNMKERLVVCDGDVVLINRYATSEFVFENEKFIIFKQEDILAKLD